MARLSFAENLKRLFGSHARSDDSFYEELADSLIEGDLGAKTAFEVVENLQARFGDSEKAGHDEIIAGLIDILTPWAPEITLLPQAGKTTIYLVLGVNGVGKTTSAGKMALWYRDRIGNPVVLAACDTFRAAAIDQLKMHGDRTGVRVVSHQSGADPGAVIFDAADSIRAQGGGLVIADTAGRLHNKENLVRELQKIDRIAEAKADEGCYKKILVLDATTGQNGLRQAEVFHESVGVDAILLTKYDSTARGGIAISVGKELGIPVAFVGTGETYADFAPFESLKYLREFTGQDER